MDCTITGTFDEDSFFVKDITRHGGSGHIGVPKKFLGQKAVVIVVDENTDLEITTPHGIYHYQLKEVDQDGN